MPTKLLAKGLTAPQKATPKRAVKLAPEGIVTAIVAVTGVVDAVDDLIVPGAFAFTLRVRRPKVVDDHEWKNKVGRVLHVEEWMPGDRRLPKRTKDGKPWPKEAGALVATMQYNLNAERGREAYEWVRFYAESNEAEFSIGYKVPEGKARKRRDGVRVILMVDLFEFSHVLFGAAPLSMALDVKSMHGGAAGQVTVPAMTGDDDTDEDYTDPKSVPSDKKPWDDDEDDKPRAGVESKTAMSVLLEAKSGNAGNADSLRKWFANGADGAIAWGSPGDFDACVAEASKHMSPEDAKGFCNLRHHDALGFYPATHAAMEGKSMSRMKGSYEERSAALDQAAQDLLSVTIEDLVTVCVVATYDTEFVVTAYPNDAPPRSYLIPYSIGDDGDADDVELGEPQPVELSLVADFEPDGLAKEADEDVETTTVIGPMLESLNTTARMASIEGKVGQAVRERFATITASLAGKSADDRPDDDYDDDDDSTPAGDTDGDAPLEADASTITEDNLPDGDWQSYRKTEPIHAMKMDGPFRVQTREGVVECDGGWLALDSDGYPYPIADDEFENVYEPDGGTDEPGIAPEPADLEAEAETPSEDLAEGTEEKTAERVTLDPDEHFKTMNDLSLDDEEENPED